MRLTGAVFLRWREMEKAKGGVRAGAGTSLGLAERARPRLCGGSTGRGDRSPNPEQAQGQEEQRSHFFPLHPQ